MLIYMKSAIFFFLIKFFIYLQEKKKNKQEQLLRDKNDWSNIHAKAQIQYLDKEVFAILEITCRRM